jgi:hypothetical protein
MIYRNSDTMRSKIKIQSYSDIQSDSQSDKYAFMVQYNQLIFQNRLDISPSNIEKDCCVIKKFSD